MNRREFLKIAIASAIPIFVWNEARPYLPQFRPNKYKTIIHTPNLRLGHAIRDLKISNHISEQIKTDTIIVGGGIGGLSAAETFANHHMKNWVLVELEDRVGGNASYDNYGWINCPTGAHYLPVQNKTSVHMINLLERLGCIADGKTLEYNEDFLLHPKEERLLKNNIWIDDIEIHTNTEKEHNNVLKLSDQIIFFKNLIGNDSKHFFEIPTANSSQDKALIEKYKHLHSISMKEWLLSLNIDEENENIHWYINYACRDDYGTTYDKVSAWAGLLYFAGRRRTGLNIKDSDLLTWDEGLGWVSKNIKKLISNASMGENIISGFGATNIEYKDSKYITTISNGNTSKQIISNNIIWAAPQLVLSKIRPDLKLDTIEYAPWFVANLRLNQPIHQEYWDNVWQDGEGLGYIHTDHQQIKEYPFTQNITYYSPIDWFDNTKTAKKWCIEQLKNPTEIEQKIIKDISIAIPNISDITQQIDIFLRPHAMAAPLKNHTSHPTPGCKKINNGFYLANSDVSMLSTAEEANYWGTEAATDILKYQHSKPLI